MTATPYRILIIDDEPDICEFMSYHLRSEGFRVDTAGSGTEGIRIAKDVNPHLVLLDIMMPGPDGFETCSQIRRLPGLQDIHIVYLTARSMNDIAGPWYRVCGDDYIMKPIRPKDLIVRLRALLELHS